MRGTTHAWNFESCRHGAFCGSFCACTAKTGKPAWGGKSAYEQCYQTLPVYIISEPVFPCHVGVDDQFPRFGCLKERCSISWGRSFSRFSLAGKVRTRNKKLLGGGHRRPSPLVIKLFGISLKLLVTKGIATRSKKLLGALLAFLFTSDSKDQ